MKHQLGFDCNNADLEIPLRRLSRFRLQNFDPTAMIQNHDGIFATCDINVLLGKGLLLQGLQSWRRNRRRRLGVAQMSTWVWWMLVLDCP